jgi:sodium/hydrogen antiporter
MHIFIFYRTYFQEYNRQKFKQHLHVLEKELLSSRNVRLMMAYIFILAGFGVLVLVTAWLPLVLHRAPLSLPIICVAIGVCIFALPGMNGMIKNSNEHLLIVERLTEFCIIISLMGAGLKLDRPVGWLAWMTTWRLIGIAMPMTIVVLAILAYSILGLSPAAALLLAASLAPTDAVLASDVQVGPPGSGEEDETRFALTSEAGLNDGLAFPFVHAAIASAFVINFKPDHIWELNTWSLWSGWVLKMVIWKIVVAIIIGYVAGRGLGRLMFHWPNKVRLSRTGDGFVALGITTFVYGLTEIASGYGFLAVFIAALSVRGTERSHKYHEKLHDVAEGLEKLVMMALLVLFGGFLTDSGILYSLGWRSIIFGLAAIFLVRPFCAWISLGAKSHSSPERAAISFYGIRGIGTVYYLSYAFQKAPFEKVELMWSTAALIILVSIFLHGSTVTPVMRHLDVLRRRNDANIL